MVVVVVVVVVDVVIVDVMGVVVQSTATADNAVDKQTTILAIKKQQ